MKTCCRCKIEQPTNNFHKSRARSDGLHVECKPCRSKMARVSHLRDRYGITVEDYNDLLIEQDSKCAICSRTVVGSLDVDHDHSTGEVRGLLCNRCNTGLGNFKDNPESLINAANYLSGGTNDWFRNRF